MMKCFVILLMVVSASLAYDKDEDDIQENAAEIAITDLIKSREGIQGDFPFIAGFVRLAFHDTVGNGRSDGCIDHNNPSNGGLKKYTDELDLLYNSFDYGMSRADFYAFASVIALEMSTTKSKDKFKGRSQFKFGRKSCTTSPIEDDSTEKFPSALSGIDTTLAYFQQEFPAYSTREVVALLGAHTLGRARMEDSGFEGRWTDKLTSGNIDSKEPLTPQSTLDNQYYKELLKPWKQVQLTSGKFEWFEPYERTVNDAFNRDSNQPIIQFNSDFCFVHNYTIIDHQGRVNCRTFCRPHMRISAAHAAKFGTNMNLPCCKKSSTLSIVQEFAFNNALWVDEFTNIFMKMIKVQEEDKEEKKEAKVGKYLNKLAVSDLEDIILDLMNE